MFDFILWLLFGIFGGESEPLDDPEDPNFGPAIEPGG